MKNILPFKCHPAFATALSMALLLFLPLMYSFHYVASKNNSPIPQTQIQQQHQDTAAAAIRPFDFNPNTISESDLNRLGLSEKVIKTILMFRSKGGTFRKVDDLNKIFGITNATFQKLKPYIKL